MKVILKRVVSLILCASVVASFGCIFASAKRAYVSIPTYNQCSNGYINGCEGFSLYMCLRGKGYAQNVTVGQFMATMPRAKTNPNYGFVGDPTKGWNAPVNRGKRTTIFPAPLTVWANRYGNAQNITGASYQTLMTELDRGNPIVIWVTYKWQTPIWRNYAWGSAVTNGHVIALVGYNTDTGKWLVNDPYYGYGEYWVNHSLLANTWASRRYAVVVRDMPYLNMDKLTLYPGETNKKKLNLVNYSGETFTSSDPSVVTASGDRDGSVLKAVSPGKAVISTSVNGKTYKLKVKVPENPVLNRENIEMYFGREKTLNLYHASGETFKSSNEKVVRVDKNGKITAVGEGKAVVTVSFRGKTYKCSVNVLMPKLNTDNVDLYLGQHKTLNLWHAEGERFKSSNTKVAHIDKDGRITAVGEGKATIYISFKGKVFKCRVNVKMPSLNVEKLDLFVGEKNKLNLVHVSGETFTSSNPSVVTVDEKGKLKAVSEGTATISVTYNKRVFKCVVSVKTPTANLTEKTLRVGDSFAFSLNEVKAEGFTSSDEKVATIDSSGTVTAVAPGTAMVKALYKGLYYNCNVTVVDDALQETTEE